MYKEYHGAKSVPYEESMGGFVPKLLDYYKSPSAYAMDPFRIYGNLYYVGDKKVCSHLIDTGDGLLLFDTGFRHAFHLQLNSIRALGFDPADVKVIIHSHGHFDHFGGGNEMRSLYGSRIYMSAVDTQLLREMPSRALMHLGPAPYDEICWPDEEIPDGGLISLGNTTVRCVLTPGHTMGTMTYFFEAQGEDGPKKVAYMGGVGFLTVYKEYNRLYGLPENKAHLMKASIEKVWNEEVEIVLGNHPTQNDTLGKREWMLSHPEDNPFVNPRSWHAFLTGLEEKRREFAALGY